MAVFEYKALNTKGKKSSGIIDAESRNAAQKKLKLQNLFPVSLTKIESRTGQLNRPAFSLPGAQFFSSIKSSEIAMITRQLATLLSAGFPLVKAVATLVEQTKSKAFKKVLSRIKEAIEEGNSFAEALALYPNVFSPVYINMVKAGEASGTLEIILERLADFAEKKEDTKKKVQASLSYPFIMLIFGMLILLFLLTKVVPEIVNIFTDMDHTLPLPTTILINISSFFKSFWWAVLLTPFLLIFILFLVRRTDRGILVTDKAVLHIPLMGGLVKKMIAARFSRTLGSLLENGVPMLTALNITRTIAGNRIISDLINRAARNVEQGGELGETLLTSNAFPNLATQMIKVGEKSGKMEKMLEKAAELFEKDVETTVVALTAILEPFIIIILGLAVALIIFAICLPIVEINQLLQ